MACSHRRRGRDKTVLSSLVANCVHTADKTVLSCLDPVSMSFLSSRPSFQFATNSLFTPPTRTRQNCLVLSVSALWTSHNAKPSHVPRDACKHDTATTTERYRQTHRQQSRKKQRTSHNDNKDNNDEVETKASSDAAVSWSDSDLCRRNRRRLAGRRSSADCRLSASTEAFPSWSQRQSSSRHSQIPVHARLRFTPPTQQVPARPAG